MAESTTNVNLIAVDFNPFDGPSLMHVAPATEPQIEIWTTCQFGENDANRAFNESISLLFTGELNSQALTQAWADLLVRHEALQSAFSADGQQICVFSGLVSEISYLDCSSKTDAAKEKLVADYVEQDALFVFDLLNGPLVKAGLIRLSDTRHHFTLTAHHIICDGWSLGILLQDLGALYSAYSANKVPTLAEAPGYSAYAVEQRQFLAGKEHQQVETFWVNQYRDGVPVLDLPTDFPRPSLRTYDIARRDLPLDSSLAGAVRQVGAKAGCSFVTTLVAAFEAFLYRLTGQRDLIVGLPTAGQSATGYLGLVGHCVNLLPLRSFPQGELRFSEYLQERKEAILDAFEHQQLTFSGLLKKIAITRDPSRVPMVPVIFNVDMGLDDGVQFAGLTYQLISNPRKFGAVELFLNISGSTADAALTFEWSYNTQLFKQATIDRMMAEFVYLLRAVTANPSQLIDEIPLANQDEQAGKLARWNATQADFPLNLPLPVLLTQTAARLPDKTALIFNGRKLSYRELDETANQVAHSIQQNGVGPGHIVGVVLDRSPELVISLLAILKAGAAYLPIDPEYPHDRIAFMLADSSANMLITSKKYHSSDQTMYQPAGGLTRQMTVLRMETLLAEIDTQSKVAPPQVTISGHDLAYILYTSGSTGQPKGVLIEHRNLVNLLHSMIILPGITPGDALLAVTTVSFDIAGLELYLPLLVGATLVLADTATTKDGHALLQTIDKQGITIIQATPATYKLMLAAGWEQRFGLKILCCGEPLSKDLAQKLTARCDSLWNMYGPTETTIYSTGKQILATDEIITIGRPIHNTQVYILDEHLQPVPEGIVGEIYIAGDGVARGYLNRPELNQEKFLPNPFSELPGKTMYRTGDLGKFMAGGEIHCLGRIDQQVKIRGYRIELGEIEHALVMQAGVKDAVVMAREDRPGDQRLVAYVVPSPPLAIDAFMTKIPIWRSKLNDVLPSYMVPSDFVSLTQLPVTPNGKIDRKALPKPDSLRIANGTDAKPVTDLEKRMSAIWADVLGVNEVGIDQDFFELGGHSMIAVQMMTQLEKETGKRLPLSTLLTHPTVQKLAQLVQADEKPITWKSLVPIKPQGSKVPIYIIHGIGLNLLNFSSLVNYMDAEQPIYGLQALGLDGTDEPLDSMDAIAAYYISEVLQQNPSGPYAIAGYSFGGYVALEMARQLKAMGKEVKMLAMFDTNAQESDSGQKQSTLTWLGRKLLRQFPKFVWFTQSLFRHPMPTIRYQQQYAERQINALLQATGLQKPPQPKDELDHLTRIMEKHEIAFHNYAMKPYDGVVDLFKAQMRLYFVDDNNYLGWKKYALKGVRIHSVPGDHELMLLPPNDKVFAQSLQRALDNS